MLLLLLLLLDFGFNGNRVRGGRDLVCIVQINTGFTWR